MILSGCSPFFRNILCRNPHQHPLLYLKGVKYTDLQSVLDFIYHGEVNVAQEELNSFLSVAEDLQVKGLTQTKAGASNTEKPDNYSHPKGDNQLPQTKKTFLPPNRSTRPVTSNLPSLSSLNQSIDDEIQEVVPIKTEPPPPGVPTVLPPAQGIYATSGSHSLAQVEDDSYACQDDQYDEYDHYQDGGQAEYSAIEGVKGYDFQDPSELLQFVKRDPGDQRYYCTICGKFSQATAQNTRNHVETKHFPNTFSYPCDQCDSVFSSKCSFSMHKSRKHKK